MFVKPFYGQWRPARVKSAKQQITFSKGLFIVVGKMDLERGKKGRAKFVGDY